jgi:hypothetical protein
MPTNILTFPQWEETSTGDIHDPALDRKEQETGRKTCKLVIIRVWTKTAEGEERNGKEKSL